MPSNKKKSQASLKSHQKDEKSRLELESEKLKEKFHTVLKKAHSDFQHDIIQVSNFQNYERIWKSNKNKWLGFFINQISLDGSRQISPDLIGFLVYIFSFYKEGDAQKILSAYSKIRIASREIRSGLRALNYPLLSSFHIKKLSNQSQSFSTNVKNHNSIKYLSYLPAFIGMSRLIINSNFFKFLYEDFKLSPYTIHGTGLVVIAEAMSYFFSEFVTKQLKINFNTERLTSEKILLFDPLEKSLESLELTSMIIFIFSIGYGFLMPLIVPIILSSSFLEEFNSTFSIEKYDTSFLIETFDWSFSLNAIVAFFITRHFCNFISKKEIPIRSTLAKEFSDLLNKKFKNVISSTVKTSHDLIHVESLNKDDKSACQFFSLALSIYCEASITGEIENQFLLALFQKFDPKMVIEKLKSRFKIHKQLRQLAQSINWQELYENNIEELSDLQPTFTPFNRENEISWLIELHDFDRSIQKRLIDTLTDLYKKKNDALKVNIENNNLIIHGLKNPTNKRKIHLIIPESHRKEVEKKNTSSTEKSYFHGSSATILHS